MAFTIDEEDLQAVVKITGKLTIEEVEGLKEALINCYDTHSGVVFDMKNVNECDSAGIQLLWSTRKTAALNNKNFSIKDPSDPLKVAAERIGIKL